MTPFLRLSGAANSRTRNPCGGTGSRILLLAIPGGRLEDIATRNRCAGSTNAERAHGRFLLLGNCSISVPDSIPDNCSCIVLPSPIHGIVLHCTTKLHPCNDAKPALPPFMVVGCAERHGVTKSGDYLGDVKVKS